MLLKIKNRLADKLKRAFYVPFMGRLGRGSYLKPGVRITGNACRIFIGSNFKVWHNAILSVGQGEIRIGNDGLIGVGSFISAGNNHIAIGNGVAIAPHCNIIAYSHHYQPSKQYVTCYSEGDITIGNNVLIGAGSTVLPGVSIGNNSVVAAGSVVNKSIPDNVLAAGVPIRIVKQIQPEET